MDSSQESLVQEAFSEAKLGNKEKAISIIDNILSINPDNARAWYLRSQLVEHPEEALHCLEQVLNLHPNDENVIRRINTVKSKHKNSSISNEKRRNDRVSGNHLRNTEKLSNDSKYLLVILGILLGVILLSLYIMQNVKTENNATISGKTPVISNQVYIAECSEQIREKWEEATYNRQNELNNDLDTILVNRIISPNDYKIFATRARSRYNAQYNEVTPDCLSTLQNLVVDGFYYNWKSLDAASNGNWEESATFAESMVSKMEKAESESYRLGSLLSSSRPATSTPFPTHTPIPSYTPPPVKTKLRSGDLMKKWQNEYFAISLLNAYKTDFINGYRPYGSLHGGFKHGFTQFLVVEVALELIRSVYEDINPTSFILTAITDDDKFEYHSEISPVQDFSTTRVYQGERFNTSITFEIKASSHRFLLCYKDGPVVDNSQTVIHCFSGPSFRFGD